VDGINERALVVRLQCPELDACLRCIVVQLLVYLGQSETAIHFWFATAKKVEVGAVEYEYAVGSSGSWLLGLCHF
jgi:hypothetical protein